MYYNVRVGLHKDKSVLFITDNEMLAKTLLRTDFVLHWGHPSHKSLGRNPERDHFDARVMTWDQDGYKVLEDIDDFLSEFARTQKFGDFMIAILFANKKEVRPFFIYNSGDYDKGKDMDLRRLINQPFNAYRKGIVVKVGNMTKSISTSEDKEIVLANDENAENGNDVHKDASTSPRESTPKRKQDPRNEKDELYDEAVTTVIGARQASVSLLQRRMRIGYTRAARLIDEMEKAGIVGPYEGSKPRQVLYRESPSEMVN
jgi:DNA segregation ATPase FtsK/SpoIIIE-like protein